MRCLFTALELMIFLLAPIAALAELEFVNISSLNIPSRFSEIYYADIDGDEISEVIVDARQNHRVYIYNGFSGDLTQTLSDFVYPTDFKFSDMNNDGRLDLICRSDSGLCIYDFADSSILWTGPSITQNYLYAIGDRNLDGYQDIAVLRWERRSDNADDTARVDFYDGPYYQLGGQTYFLIAGYSNSHDLVETPSAVLFENFSGVEGIRPRIAVFIESYYFIYYMDPWWTGYIEIKFSGSVKMIDPQTYNIASINTWGEMSTYNVDSTDNDRVIYGIFEYFDSVEGHGYPSRYANTKYLRCLDADGQRNSRRVWGYEAYNFLENGPEWHGILLGNMDESRLGPEFYYCLSDTINVISCRDTVNIWQQISSQWANGNPRLYHNDSLFNSPQILTGIPLVTINGADGTLSGVFLNPLYNFRDIIDLNHDGEDEIILTGDFAVGVYHISGDPELGGIGEDLDNLPNQYHLYANYPNPFNARTTIRYSISQSGPVTIAIYNLLGQKVTTVFDGLRQPGEFSYNWDASGYPSGVYFARLKSKDDSQNIKMVLMK